MEHIPYGRATRVVLLLAAFGGNIYGDWASVPRTYKSGNSSPPDPGRFTASIFTFNWR